MNNPTAPSRQEQFQGRQDTFLIEAINRVRRLTGLSQTQRSKKPLLVVVTKFDLWRQRVEVSSFVDPWREKNGRAGLDVPRIQRGSEEIRALLKQVAPELVGAAESISEQVLYWPASALGCTPKTDPHTGAPMIRPADIQPFGVAVPVLYGLLLTTFGLIPYTQKPLATR